MRLELSLCGTTSVLHKNEYIIVGKYFKILILSVQNLLKIDENFGRTILEMVNSVVG